MNSRILATLVLAVTALLGLAAAAAQARPTTAAAPAADPGRHVQLRDDRRHGAAVGQLLERGRRGARRRGVLQVAERAGRRQQAQDQLQVLRRPVQRDAHRPVHAAARRARPRLRHLQHTVVFGARQPGDPPLPEPARRSCPAPLPGDRLDHVGRDSTSTTRYSMGYLPSYVAEGEIYAKHLLKTQPTRRSASSTRATTTAAT